MRNCCADGVEVGPGCSARGRWRSLVGLRGYVPSCPAHQAPLVWRVSEGQAAVPVGGGGAWPGFEATRRAEGSRRGRARGRAAAHGAARPGRAHRAAQHEAKPQELGGVTTHGSVDKERNPEIPRASAMSEAQRAPGTPSDEPINDTTSTVDQPRPRRSERVTAPSRLAKRAPEGASARGTCA